MIPRLWLGAILGLMVSSCSGGAGSSIVLESPPETTLTTVAVTVQTTISTVGASTTSLLDQIGLIPWESASLSGRDPPGPVPTRIVIDEIGVDAEVVSMGIDDQGQMEVPDNVTTVGWYGFGVRPGDVGSAVLTAHVDLAGSGPGVFFDLDELAPSDSVLIAFADGSQRSFSVVSTERVAKPDIDVETLFARDGGPVVRLVTCGGAFNPQVRRYDDNLIVTLSPTSPDQR